MPAIFQPRIAKKINKAPSARVIVICSDSCKDDYLEKVIGEVYTALD